MQQYFTHPAKTQQNNLAVHAMLALSLALERGQYKVAVGLIYWVNNIVVSHKVFTLLQDKQTELSCAVEEQDFYRNYCI